MAKLPQFTLTKEGFHATRIRAGRAVGPDGKKGKSQQLRVTIRTRDEKVFYARHARLTALSRTLTPKGLTNEARFIILQAAEQESDAAFELCCQTGAKLTPRAAPGSAKSWHTFQDLADDYVSGEFHRIYGKRPKATLRDDASLLRGLLPSIGHVPLKAFTVQNAQTAMANLPPTTKRDTRRNHYWQVMHRLLELAVYPCLLLPSNPLLREHRPDIEDGDIEYPYLFPREDWLICRYTGPGVSEGVPLNSPALRALFGAANREGPRLGELLRGLLWTGVDRVNGRINVGPRKNGKVGQWPAQPGTIEALWSLRDLVPGVAELPGPFHGLPHDDLYARRLHDLLVAAGVDRHELLHSGPGRGRLRAHDTRSTFITLAKAYDMPESWIMRHTGHKHSTQLATYDHASGEWREEQRGKLVRLDVALGLAVTEEAMVRYRPTAPDPLDPEPETESETVTRYIVRHTVPEKWKSGMISAVPKTGLEPVRVINPADFESRESLPEGAPAGVTPRTLVAPSDPQSPPVSPAPTGLRQGATVESVAPPMAAMDAPRPLIDALEAAAAAAVKAHDWTTVAALGQLIDEHVRAAAAAQAKVTSLESVRRKREGGES